MKFEFEQQTAVSLINILNQLPTSSGVFPLVQDMIRQFNEQTKEEPKNEQTSN